MTAVYEVSFDIPELDILAGDVITLRPSHPTNPFLVTRRQQRGRMPLLLDHLDRMVLIELSGASCPADESELRLHLMSLPAQPLAPPSREARPLMRLVR